MAPHRPEDRAAILVPDLVKLIECLGRPALRSGAVHSIRSVVDQYLDVKVAEADRCVTKALTLALEECGAYVHASVGDSRAIAAVDLQRQREGSERLLILAWRGKSSRSSSRPRTTVTHG